MAPTERSRSANGSWLAMLERDTHAVLTAVENLSGDVSTQLRDSVGQRPFASLGLGFLAGYVLGGGLTPRVATLLLGTAGRALVASAIASAASAVVEGGEEARSE